VAVTTLPSCYGVAGFLSVVGPDGSPDPARFGDELDEREEVARRLRLRVKTLEDAIRSLRDELTRAKTSKRHGAWVAVLEIAAEKLGVDPAFCTDRLAEEGDDEAPETKSIILDSRVRPYKVEVVERFPGSRRPKTVEVDGVRLDYGACEIWCDGVRF
jgi:hypothetical protein